jgi:hypothetical protein
MSKVIFTISYDIKPELRDAYLALSTRMREHLAQANGRNYAVYEQKGKKNSFTEVFVCNSLEEYEQLEDQDELTTSLVSQLEGLLANGKMKYSTMIEVESGG